MKKIGDTSCWIIIIDKDVMMQNKKKLRPLKDKTYVNQNEREQTWQKQDTKIVIEGRQYKQDRKKEQLIDKYRKIKKLMMVEMRETKITTIATNNDTNNDTERTNKNKEY